MHAGRAALAGQQSLAPDQRGSWFVAVGGVVVAVVFSALAAHLMREAWRAWHDPDWEPSRRIEPRNVAAGAIAMSSIAVMMICFVALSLIPGTGRGHDPLVFTAVMLITFCILGVFAVTGSAITIRRFGRPRFLIPPRMRPAEGQPADAPWEMSVDPLTASVPREPWASDEVRLLDDECYLASDYTRTGWLQLTTDRIIFQRNAPDDTPRYPIFLTFLGTLLADKPSPPSPFDQTRCWSLADVRTVRPRARRTLSIGFADGTEESFVLRHGNLGRWLRTMANARGMASQLRAGTAVPVQADCQDRLASLCCQVVRRTRLRSSGKAARPYIWRLIIFKAG